MKKVIYFLYNSGIKLSLFDKNLNCFYSTRGSSCLNSNENIRHDFIS